MTVARCHRRIDRLHQMELRRVPLVDAEEQQDRFGYRVTSGSTGGGASSMPPVVSGESSGSP